MRGSNSSSSNLVVAPPPPPPPPKKGKGREGKGKGFVRSLPSARVEKGRAEAREAGGSRWSN